MDTHPLILVDRDRFDVFTLIGHSRQIFQSANFGVDEEGVAWKWIRIGDAALGVTWLGPNQYFDQSWRQQYATKYENRLEKMRRCGRRRHQVRLDERLSRLKIGPQASRLLWVIHRELINARSSLLKVADCRLADAIWGYSANRPRHWRRVVRVILGGFCSLHVGVWDSEGVPNFGPGTSLITHVGDLSGMDEDKCGPECDAHFQGRHHHFQIDVGPGFLGVLEAFASIDNESGIRSYDFKIAGKGPEPTLRRVGKSAKLISVFLPSMIGDPPLTSTLTATQHRLLQTLIRETTRERRQRRNKITAAEQIVGNQVPDFYGKRKTVCPLLAVDKQYVGFNGNGKRRGQGYRLSTDRGWLFKAGYPLTDLASFLDDLTALTERLAITVCGLSRKGRHFALPTMRRMLETPPGKALLSRLHVRIYGPSDYLDRWSQSFLGESEESTAVSGGQEILANIKTAIKDAGISRSALAKGLDIDPSYLTKILNGRKPSPAGFLDAAQEWARKAITEHQPSACVPEPRGRFKRLSGLRRTLDIALTYLAWGWSIVPQAPGAKMPTVKWKPFQDERPSSELVESWFAKWPDAGIALILGPTSNVFVIDVDGTEAHAVLINRLGKEPSAPKVLSGSREPFRYHLFFQCPNSVVTRAKLTPWHEKLEFRGFGGILIVPPSKHKSGHRYVWAPGRSPDEISLPQVPPEILNALKPARKKEYSSPVLKRIDDVDASRRTLAFLTGRYANESGWNQRLFNAACDLHGRKLPLSTAEPLLLAGARPWTKGDEDLARRTIQSAFAKPREPGQF